MSVLLLVRHGQASFGKRDYDQLSEIGLRQAAALGRALRARGVAPERIVTGAMKRHQQTARTMRAAAGWRMEIEEDPGWDEYDHDAILRAYRPAYRHRSVLMADMARTLHPRRAFQSVFTAAVERWTSGEFADYEESFQGFRARVAEASERCLDRDGMTIAVTSGGPVASIATGLLGDHADVWTRLQEVCMNSSVTKVVAGQGDSPTLVSFNDHSHLESQPELMTYR
ncbi:histidine phosphatase family protein [Calidifontibacter sp. DB0510]|uniref:Histidine phosphatase family protein n=1 Tax=Metallococcus carri TaxID=1656884 RepID=A0A967AZW6_9MICO|nr:histidine phosphatase family protein [Metallococcus carri]NHN55449.1 histidine phosphatase family protein [Metallococcus carri]NOP38367.1 histidine phosphatase family protein [Calidifontibacter sp. DB2511S]